eukprot:TRINITY_DN27366_c0_g1_i1.p1 TRINITY_DN27366_c0_g1~~TRINITY_DN27366_c0_g1_i1.p1  ORF type:complete len:276 (+),score=36.48 TRINITY_DN27366_c0_g1_i1:156-983(+)
MYVLGVFVLVIVVACTRNNRRKPLYVSSASSKVSKSSSPKVEHSHEDDEDTYKEGEMTNEGLAWLSTFGGAFDPPKGLLDDFDCGKFKDDLVIGVSEYCSPLEHQNRVLNAMNVTTQHCMLFMRTRNHKYFSLEYGSSDFQRKNEKYLSKITCLDLRGLEVEGEVSNDADDEQAKRGKALFAASKTWMAEGAMTKTFGEVNIHPLSVEVLRQMLREYVDAYHTYRVTSWNCQLFTTKMIKRLTGIDVLRANENILKLAGSFERGLSRVTHALPRS